MALQETPIPCRYLINRARKKKHANNGEESQCKSRITTKECPGYWYTATMNQKVVASLSNEQKTRTKPDGTFYRIGWSTPEERAEEIRKAS